MLYGPALAVLLLLGSSCAEINRYACRCSALRPGELGVDCSFKGLTEVPPLPPATGELYLQDNQLTAVAPGRFDALQGLRRANLSGNPWDCGCGIRYLRVWLRDRRDRAGDPTCASPPALARKAVTELTDEDLAHCAPPCNFLRPLDTLTIILLCAVIGLLLYCLRMAKSSTFILNVDQKHRGMKIESLKSLKPKHRKLRASVEARESGSTYEWTDDLDRSVLNMEILPQILDALQKKHNIKIKAT